MATRRFGKDAGFDSKRSALELEKKKRDETNKINEEEFKSRRNSEYAPRESELKAINSVFKIYDQFSEGAIDSGLIPDALRALGLNPTIGFVEKVAGTVKPGEKSFTEQEFIPIYSACKQDKDSGVYEDFIECLKLYDKAECGMMPLAELSHALTYLGERLNDDELDAVLRDCMGPEDDEGNIAYIPFLARMCEKPVPKSIKPM